MCSVFEIYDINLAMARLSRTIIKVDGVYQYVVGVDFTDRSGYTIMDNNGNIRRLNAVKVEYDEMKIGMLEFPSGDIHWASRMPVRKWKVGLHSSNFVYRTFSNKAMNFFRRETFERSLVSIFKMLNQEYTPLDAAVTQGYGAISQHFALKGSHLYRKTTKVGTIKDNIKLLPKYSYFQQQFDAEVLCTDK